MTDLHPGDKVRLKAFRDHHALAKGQSGLLSVSYNPPRGKVFVMLLMGVEPANGDNPLDMEAVLRAFGWEPIAERSNDAG